MRFWTGIEIKELQENQIFVFGSNPEGRHGAGAAKAAMKFGAKYGVGRGLQGQTYALVTKNLTPGFQEKKTQITYKKSGYFSVSDAQIIENIKELYKCARENPDKIFLVTYKYETNPDGSPARSLNGYTGIDMYSMFTHPRTHEGFDFPNNVVLHESFKLLKLLEEKAQKENVLSYKNKKEYYYFWESKNPCSQWFPSVFTFKEKTFTSCEQFMMYSKAKLFGDEEVAQKIIDINKEPLVEQLIKGEIRNSDIIEDRNKLVLWNSFQKKIKNLGRMVQDFNEDEWISKRIAIISVANREKFSQDPDLMSFLYKHRKKTFVEASPYDTIYGIGMREEDALKVTSEQWKGQNILGDVITNTCARLMNNYKPVKKNNLQKP